MINYIDLSRPFSDRMPVYPGDDESRLEQIKNYEKDGHTDFRLTTNMHTGTHIDGPMHLTSVEQFIADIPLDRFIGGGAFMNAEGEMNIGYKREYDSLIFQGAIVVLHTGFGKKYGSEEYFSNHPVISDGLAQFFIAKGIKMICLDLPSPDRPPYPLHKLFFDHGILIAENLVNLDRLAGFQKFEIIALPLKMKSDSSPARIIARISA